MVPESKADLFFYGYQGNTFLTPRGVHTVGAKLIVADTAQNRILIGANVCHFISNTLRSIRSVIASDKQRNSGVEASAATLLYPSEVLSDGNKLIVADA